MIAKTGDEALLQSREELFLRRKIEVEGAFGHIRGFHDLIDAGGRDPLFQKQFLRGIEEFLAPDFRRLGAGARRRQ